LCVSVDEAAIVVVESRNNGLDSSCGSGVICVSRKAVDDAFCATFKGAEEDVFEIVLAEGGGRRGHWGVSATAGSCVGQEELVVQ
jgi:hypothetical protein